MINETIFRAYDIRGVYPSEINEETVYLTAKAYAEWLKPKKVALGRDVRVSGPSLFEEAKRGLLEMGVDVVDIGVVTTEMFYFAVGNYGFDGGISITASHNPGEYNGMKVVRKGVAPISIDTGLQEIRDIAVQGNFQKARCKGKLEALDITDDYLNKLYSFVDISKIKPMKVVVNPSNGAAGKVVELVGQKIGLDLIKQNFEPDGTFPKGPPNPLLSENQTETKKLIIENKADLGIAWDGDADRVFFFDENGEFVEPYYMIAILCEIILKNNPGKKVVTDGRLLWATLEKVKEAGGEAVLSKSGHSFIKQLMREENAVLGVETSAHYYFRDFFYADNGMIPALLIWQELSKRNIKLSKLVNPLRAKYPISGEINFKVDNGQEKLKEIGRKYSDGKINHLDGLTVEYSAWRLSFRLSNTEPVARLNIEAKTKELVQAKVNELTQIIEFS